MLLDRPNYTTKIIIIKIQITMPIIFKSALGINGRE